MKKVKYEIKNKKVLIQVYDTKLKAVLNFKCIFMGNTIKECEQWLKGYKKGLYKPMNIQEVINGKEIK